MDGMWMAGGEFFSRPLLWMIPVVGKGKGTRMDDEITKVTLGDEFKVCPSCGYEDGFHSMFKRDKRDP